MPEQTVQELNIKIKVDYDKKEIEFVNANFKKATEQIENIRDVGKSAKVSMNDLANALGITGLSLLGIINTGKMFINVIQDGIKQAIENEIALAKLSFRLQTLGDDYRKNIDILSKWSDEISKITIFDQTEIIKSLDTLIKYTGDVSSAQKLLVSAIKLATVEHKDLISVVTELGTAIAMPEYGLRKLRREYGNLVGDAKNVTEAIENISNRLEKHNDLVLTSEQKAKKFARIWREEIVEKTGKFWLNVWNNVLSGLYDSLLKIGDILYDIWKRFERFFDVTIGRIIRFFSMSRRMLDEYDKEAEKIRRKEIEGRKKQEKSLDDYEKKFKDVIIKIKKDEEKELEERKKIEEKKLEERKKIENQLIEYLNKKKLETYEGAIELLNKEIEEYKNANINKELIERYYNERLNEINKKFLEENNKKQEEILRKQEEIFRENYEKIKDVAEPIINSIVDGMKQGLIEMIDEGNIAAENFEKIWDRIKKSFVNALTSMVAEYIAKLAIFGTLGILFPSVGMSGIMNIMGQSGKGLFGLIGLQEGGIVTKPTIAMIGEKGPEAVIPLDKTKSLNKQEVIVNINAWDVRYIERQNIERLIRQILPILKRELKI
jgi:hypothetical protein